jgi:hypothetical protein
MSVGAAAVRDGFDSQAGGIFESGGAEAGPQSRLKVWWVQAEALLALWKLHVWFDGTAGGAGADSAGVAANATASNSAAAGGGGGGQHTSSNNSAASPQLQQQQQRQQQQHHHHYWWYHQQGSSYYLRVLQETVRFVKERQTDSAGGGEQFWQVGVGVCWCGAHTVCVRGMLMPLSQALCHASSQLQSGVHDSDTLQLGAHVCGAWCTVARPDGCRRQLAGHWRRLQGLKGLDVEEQLPQQPQRALPGAVDAAGSERSSGLVIMARALMACARQGGGGGRMSWPWSWAASGGVDMEAAQRVVHVQLAAGVCTDR